MPETPTNDAAETRKLILALYNHLALAAATQPFPSAARVIAEAFAYLERTEAALLPPPPAAARALCKFSIATYQQRTIDYVDVGGTRCDFPAPVVLPPGTLVTVEVRRGA